MRQILKVTELRVSSNYAKSGLTVIPAVGDILYSIDIPDNLFSQHGGKLVLNIEGIRHIIKGLHVALILDADKEGS